MEGCRKKGNKRKKRKEKIMKGGFEMKKKKEHERERVMKRKKGLGKIFQVRHLDHSKYNVNSRCFKLHCCMNRYKSPLIK